MANPEVGIISRADDNIGERTEQAVNIARDVLVAPISTERFAKLLQRGIHPEDFSFCEVKLIQKCDKSDASRGLVMPIGGKIEPYESAYRGGLRELSEEGTFLSMHPEQEARLWEQSSYPAYNYKIPGYDQPRRIQMLVLRVYSSTFSVHEPREGKDGDTDKISRIISLNLDRLKQLVRRGTVRYRNEIIRAAEHFTTLDTGIDVSEEDSIARKVVLNGVMSEVKNFDQCLKAETLMAVNRVRRAKKLELASGLSDCTHTELLCGFIAAQTRLAHLDERNRELTHKTTPPAKADLLRFINYLVEAPPEMFSEFLLSAPTHETIHAVNLLKRAFREGARVIVSEIEGEENSSKYDPVKKLRSIWPRVLDLPLFQRVTLLEKADQAMRAKLAQLTGFSEDNINQAVQKAGEFHDFITNSLRQHEDFGKAIYQEHRPMNEILNAKLFSRALFALRIHPNRETEQNGSNIPNVITFEAMRDLVVFTTANEAISESKQADNKFFHSATETMFEFPPIRRDIDLAGGKQHTVYYRTTAMEVNGRKISTLYDERPKKDIESSIRKKFQDPQIHDIFCVNFALADDNFTRAKDPISARLQAVTAFREALLTHIQNVLGLRSSVFILPGTLKRTCLEWIEQNKEQLTTEALIDAQAITGGKRAGSKGNSIAREKFVLCIQAEDGTTEEIEVNIYPFESSQALGISRIGDVEIFGFIEKMNDDSKGIYGGDRILVRSQDDPSRPSLHESLYPPQYYTKLSDKMRRRHVPVAKKISK